MRAVRRSLKHLGEPDTSQSEAEQLLHTRECLLKIGKHINDILSSFNDPDKISEWRRWTCLNAVVIVTVLLVMVDVDGDLYQGCVVGVLGIWILSQGWSHSRNHNFLKFRSLESCQK